MSSVVPGVRHPIALFRVCLGVAMFWAWAQETASLPAGATYMVAPLGGGSAVTVIAAVPLFPSLVAVIVANPAAPPVTSPVALTAARAASLVAQVTDRPVSRLPAESRSVAVSCNVTPTKMLATAGVTVTVATGAFVTLMTDVPFFPSLVAVIVAEPAATPATNPLVLTVATAVLLLTHVTVRPVRGVPFESFGVAVNSVVAPTVTLTVVGLTVTDATGTSVIVTAAVSASAPPFWVAITR